jgi:hypothetical protein
MPSAVGDWLVIASVIVLLIAVYWAVGNFIDNCLDFWRTRKDDP